MTPQALLAKAKETRGGEWRIAALWREDGKQEWWLYRWPLVLGESPFHSYSLERLATMVEETKS